jgi:DNA-binding response OmpR family regulator
LTQNALVGCRILVVEDDPLIAAVLADILQDTGAEVVGPAATLDEAESLARANGISVALLDIRLAESEVWPAAQILAENGVPIVFCTGHYDAQTLPPEWLGRPILTKPARPKQIVAALADLVADQPWDRCRQGREYDPRI